jgi:hypothetical protein
MDRSDVSTPPCPRCGAPHTVYKAQTLATVIYMCQKCSTAFTESRRDAQPSPSSHE